MTKLTNIYKVQALYVLFAIVSTLIMIEMAAILYTWFLDSTGSWYLAPVHNMHR